MKRWAMLIGAAVSLLCLAFFVVAFSKHWGAVSELAWSRRAWVGVALASGLYVFTYLPMARGWQWILAAARARVSYMECLRILLLSQFVKYLPGNVGHHVGRVILAQKSGVSTDLLIMSLLCEIFLVLLAGLACSSFSGELFLDLLTQNWGSAQESYMAFLPLGLMAFLVLMVPKIRGFLLSSLRKISPFMTWQGFSFLSGSFCLHVMSFCFGALAIFTLVAAVSPEAAQIGLSSYPHVLGVYAVAWILGFAMPGSPAGLGVRELVLLAGLSPLAGPVPATAVAALYRLSTVAGDGIAFAVGLYLKPSKLGS